MRSVFIVGLGAQTSLGMDLPSTAAAVRAGISMTQEHPYVVDKCGNSMMVSTASYISERVRGSHRLGALLLPVLLEAFQSGHHHLNDNKNVALPIYLGLPECRPGLADNVVEQIASQLQGTMPWKISRDKISTRLCGHAAGLLALQDGYRALRNGTTNQCLVAGVDSYLEPLTLEWLDEKDQIHSTDNSWGFVPGEAAGACLLVSQRDCSQVSEEMVGKILGFGEGNEEHSMFKKSVCVGRGLSTAFDGALAHLPMNTMVNEIICDMNGEPFRGNEFGFTMVRHSKSFHEDCDFLTPADCWGDVGAASGPLHIALALASGNAEYSEKSKTLIWASSEAGCRAAALIESIN